MGRKRGTNNQERLTYDTVGNRLTETTAGFVTLNYTYDSANRLTSVDGMPYTWDANGNLLSDGVSTYTYNHANQLTGVSQRAANYSFAYDGLGNRLRQITGANAVNYVLDISGGLTQVLADGTNTYLYGLERIAQGSTSGMEYYLGDALGSVRQMADAGGGLTLSRNYEPYGTAYAVMGSASTAYGFTGEWTDGTGLVNLRARYYAANQGRFVSQDAWEGKYDEPATFNKWLYANANPIIYIDPRGFDPMLEGRLIHLMIENHYVLYYSEGRFVRPNYLIEEASKKKTGYRGYADLADRTLQQLYEIKPIQYESLGVSDLNWYLSFLPGWTPGTHYPNTPIEIGPWPMNPAKEVLATMRIAGVIIYWGEPRGNPVPIPVPVPVPNKAPDQNKQGSANPSLQPVLQTCEKVIITAIPVIIMVVVTVLSQGTVFYQPVIVYP